MNFEQHVGKLKQNPGTPRATSRRVIAEDLSFLKDRAAELGDDYLEDQCVQAEGGDPHALVYVQQRLDRWDEDDEEDKYRARFWG